MHKAFLNQELSSSQKQALIGMLEKKDKESLTLSWRRPISYKNQSIDLLCKSMDWFLYDNDLRRERVKKWRPISLLNTDLKIIRKVLSERIKHVLPFLISSNQAAYLCNNSWWLLLFNCCHGDLRLGCCRSAFSLGREIGTAFFYYLLYFFVWVWFNNGNLDNWFI